MQFFLKTCVVLLTLLVAGHIYAEEATPAEPPFPPDQIEFFEKEVRPLLVARCYECHSAKSEEIKGGLRLDSRATAIAGGDTGAAIQPGKPKESLLIDSINYGDVYQMPPKSKLPAKEIAILTKWVELGAPWPEEAAVEVAGGEEFDWQHRKQTHWAWQSIDAAEIPAVKDTAWPQADLDRFILARLEAERWQPAAKADRRTLIRRVYFDLIGLPPKPAEVEAFLADESPDAFRKVVDHLLASPHFGERWARHWLDLVRYAESRGHEFDYNATNAHEYRDYVIRALNADVPYDQFVIEQIAGDLLDSPRTGPSGENESIVGTGFWFLGEWVHSPVDIREDEASRFDNMIDVFSKAFLGMTVACARCHDHKFDAIAQSDYYALQGFLQSSGYRQVRFETELHNEQVAGDLASLRAKHTPAIAKAVASGMQPIVDKLDAYLLAAHEALEADAPQNSAADKLAAQYRAAASELAARDSLNERLLLAWMVHLADDKQHDASPVGVWGRMTRAANANDAQNMLNAFAARQTPDLESVLAESEVVINYANFEPHEWMSDGPTFGRHPLPVGSIVLADDPQRPIEQIMPHAAARRDSFWNGLSLAPGTQKESGRNGGWVQAGQTMKTPSFTLTASHVHYLVRGAARVNALVDSHRVNQGPLHGRLLTRFDTKGELKWISQNLDRYRGHGLHVEFSAEGEQPLEIVAVVQAERAPKVPQANLAAEIARIVKDREATDLGERADLIQQRFRRAVDQLSANAIENGIDAELLNWMLANPQLFRLDDAAAREHLATSASPYVAELTKLSERRKLVSRTAMAMWDGTAVDERLFIRGNHRTLGNAVPRRSLLALGDLAREDYGNASGRLQLARKLTSTENPLVSRVMVNRVWHHLFGHGLVRSVDNFGVLGVEPSHPALLDHLATHFMQDGWSVKRLIRTIVLSSSYQMQSSSSVVAATAADPTNRLLYRQNMRRLEGEIIRDSILAVSGRLDDTMYGRSVPVHLTNFLQGRGRPASGPVDGNGRRSIYLGVRRNFLSPMMLAFDTPIPFTCVGRRNVSNVPAQALILLNDPLVTDQAQRWAKSLLAQAGDSESRIERIYQQAFAREATPRELAAAKGFLDGQGAQYELTTEQAAGDLRVWSDLCHVVFNAKEFVFVR